MNRVILLAFCICGLIPAANGQLSNPRSWQNRKPFEGYWQQDVHYKIKAVINDTTDIITGEEELTYYNNSPDTLRFVYFRLYQNAFQPGSYLDDLQEHNDAHPMYGKYERKRLGTKIDTLLSNGKALKTELDNTILKVFLHKPLLPNSSVSFSVRFKTYYDSGTTRRRMKKFKVNGFKHYNGCQWYPKLCVYDRKFGWETDQHLNREFYGDFGTFDVELTFPSIYIVEATGILQNESEMLPDTLKKKLDIYNFKDKKWDSKADTVIPFVKGETKTWKYHAENVHDFAFTADPTYRIHDTIIYLSPALSEGEGANSQQSSNNAAVKVPPLEGFREVAVRCIAIVQESHASGWQNASEYLAKIITVFSRDFGVYEYPKIVVADAQDGMEYPMLTLDGGRDPDYHYLLIHEVGHNWFYGMVGNNETYRAMLDEGFTQFLTAWGLEQIDGDTMITEPVKNWYVRRFAEPWNPRDRNFFISYLSDAIAYNDEPLNTHSDGFNGALGQGGGYRHVYAKTATMLYDLQYVLGDSLFLEAMKHYVEQWKFAHPYPEDFRNSIIQYTHVDLNWFFDQWMETTKNIDYKIGRIKKGKAADEYSIRLKRKGRMQMPIDLRVISKNDSVYDYHIPNGWFEKYNLSPALSEGEGVNSQQPGNTAVKVPPSEGFREVAVLPRWIGWDKLQPTYEAIVTVPGGIKNVIIDPSERLADINMLDNRKRGKVELRFDSHIYPPASWKKYRMYMRPDIWWNAYDGFKLGVHLEGNYMYVKHNFSFTMWLNTHLAQGKERFYLSEAMNQKAGWFSYIFSYSTALDKVFRKSTFYFNSRWLDGYEMYRTGIMKQLPQNVSLDFHIKAFTRNKEEWRNYLLYPAEWDAIWTSRRRFNTSLNLTLTYNYYKQKATGSLVAKLRSSSLFSSFNYHYLEVTQINRSSAWKFDFRTRFYGRIGTGNNQPSESALYFAGGNPEEMMESKYYRAAGFVPQSWAWRYGDDVNRLHFGGGLNMRGYAGYLLAEKDKNGTVTAAYKGQSGAAVNAEMDFNRIVPVKNKWLREHFTLNTYLFADAGVITFINSESKQEFSQVRVDAGAGLALTLKKWGPLQNIRPLTLRFDVPFFASHTPFVNPEHFAFRWVVGVSRAF